jgi:hypothetical protein
LLNRLVHVPGLDDQQQTGQGTGGGQPLLAAYPFAEDGPGEQQGPDRHGEDQHGGLARAALNQRPGLEDHEAGDLRQADAQGLPGRDQFERATEQLEDNEQGQRAAQASFGSEGKRWRVGQPAGDDWCSPAKATRGGRAASGEIFPCFFSVDRNSLKWLR